jgi:hypothetical protein
MSKTMLIAKVVETGVLVFLFILIVTHINGHWFLGFVALSLCLFLSEWTRNRIVSWFEGRSRRVKGKGAKPNSE